MNKSPILSFLIGAVAGFVGYRVLFAKKNGNGAAPANGSVTGLGGTRDYPYLTDWDAFTKGQAIMQQLAGVGVNIGRLNDVPSTFYGGAEALPSFYGEPEFLLPYDPDGPKDFLFGGFGPGPFGPPGGPA